MARHPFSRRAHRRNRKTRKPDVLVSGKDDPVARTGGPGALPSPPDSQLTWRPKHPAVYQYRVYPMD